MRYDYQCSNDHIFEINCSMNDKPIEPPCIECGEPSKFIITKAPYQCTVIVPTYPGRVTAGNVHILKRPATKLMSGPGGMSRPKEASSWVKESFQPELPNSLRGK